MLKSRSVFPLLIAVLLLSACAQSPTVAANPLPNTGSAQQATPVNVPVTIPTRTPTAAAAPQLSPTPAATAGAAASPTQAPAQVPTGTAAAPALAVTSVDESVTLNGYNMASYNSACQATLTFSANIGTNGAGTVTYYWQRSDGTFSPERTLTYTAPGYQTVTDTWTLVAPGALGNASDRVYIDQPNHAFFSPVGISLNCNPSLPKPRPARPGGKPRK